MRSYFRRNSKMRSWPLATKSLTQGHLYTYEINSNLLDDNPVKFCNDTIRNEEKHFLAKFWNFRGGERKIFWSGRTQDLTSKGNTHKQHFFFKFEATLTNGSLVIAAQRKNEWWPLVTLTLILGQQTVCELHFFYQYNISIKYEVCCPNSF